MRIMGPLLPLSSNWAVPVSFLGWRLVTAHVFWRVGGTPVRTPGRPLHLPSTHKYAVFPESQFTVPALLGLLYCPVSLI